MEVSLHVRFWGELCATNGLKHLCPPVLASGPLEALGRRASEALPLNIMSNMTTAQSARGSWQEPTQDASLTARREDEASYKCITQMIYIPDMALNGENENVIIFHPVGARQQWRGQPRSMSVVLIWPNRWRSWEIHFKSLLFGSCSASKHNVGYRKDPSEHFNTRNYCEDGVYSEIMEWLAPLEKPY